MAVCMAEHVPRSIPYFVAKISVALHTANVELDVAPRGSERIKCIAECIGAISGNALRELFAGRFFNFFCQLRLHQIGRALGYQRFKLDAIDQVNRVQHVPFGFGHFLSLTIADESMHVYGVKRHFVHELQ